MVTVEQILAAEGEELSKLLGEVLQNMNDMLFKDKCGRCETLFVHPEICPTKFRGDDKCDKYDEFYDPIPLDWDNAMKWRDWAVKEFDANIYGRALLAIYRASKYYDCLSYDTWLACKTKPKHYLQAAAICKLNAEKGKQ